jgi:hypothetical protein
MIQFMTAATGDDSSSNGRSGECQITDAVENLVTDGFIRPAEFVFDDRTVRSKDDKILSGQMPTVPL